MDKEERGKLYNKIFDNFIDLTNGLIDEVIISPYELMELNAKTIDKEVYFNKICDVGIMNNYADVLIKGFGDKLSVERDIKTGNYIFKRRNK